MKGQILFYLKSNKFGFRISSTTILLTTLMVKATKTWESANLLHAKQYNKQKTV